MSIAFFDSGLGGVTVLREARKLLPQHDFLYMADSGHCPYGPRPTAWVRARSLALGQALHDLGARLLVVPCHTATAAALPELRQELPMPVVGMEPGVKPGVAATRNGVVGILATAATAQSERLEGLIARFAGDAQVLIQPCPGLADRIDTGDFAGPETRRLLAHYLEPLLARGADTIVLACTHYPLIMPLMRDLVGPNVALIDTAPAVARQVARRAAESAIAAGGGSLLPFSSGNPAALAALLRTLQLHAAPVRALDPQLAICD
jgi:glutamate racemase